MNSLLQTAITAALQAGKAILDIYDDPASDFEIEHKADHSPLTIADRVSNEIILKQLKNTPYPVISEENKATAYAIRKQWQTVWIVDPFYGGRPALGVIYIPVKKILYYGTIRNGAYRADHPEYSPDMDFDALENQARRLPLDREDPVYTVVASRSHMSSDTENFIDELKKEHGEVKLTSIGSSIKICLVAEGTADIYPRFAPTMEWDTAAGHAIAKAAGKELYHQDGCTPLAYNKEDLLNPWFIVK